MNETETTVETIDETAKEKKKKQRREYMRDYRAKNAQKEPAEKFAEIAELWETNSRELKQSDPVLYAELLARHNEVEELEAEGIEILKGVGVYLWPRSRMKRAETVSALTPDPENVMPMPDLCFRDIKKDTNEHGSANYRQIEADALNDKPLDADSDIYKQYGFRLRIQSDTLRDVREALVLYALTTRDQNLDWQIVREAIEDNASYKGFSSHTEELHLLIRQYRAEASVVSEMTPGSEPGPEFPSLAEGSQ
jgi:hypothetical protein